MTEVAPPRSVQFLVVGSPRSGTTLVQRLACEIPGVAMPPETHFFTRFASRLSAEHHFPVHGQELIDIVTAFAGAGHTDGLDVDVEAVVTELGGSCDRPMHLFDALVRYLTGPADVLGEKTPGHLVWWRPISVAAPWMRFVAVVRDPRAVVASNLDMPWRTDPTLPAWGDRMHLAFAELWSFFQGQVVQMRDTLGPDRCLVLLYEEVVADPEGTRDRLTRFLGRPHGLAVQEAPAGIVLPWESWKTQALEPMAEDRIDAWQDSLDPNRAAEVAVVCRKLMRHFGYADGASSGVTGWARLGPGAVMGLARYARSRRINLRAVESTPL
jgi:hypothetical protein